MKITGMKKMRERNFINRNQIRNPDQIRLLHELYRQ